MRAVIHHATTEFDDGVCHWVSLDGEHWLPINRPPHPSDTEDDLEALFAGRGTRRLKPLVFTRSYLAHEGARFLAGGDD